MADIYYDRLVDKSGDFYFHRNSLEEGSKVIWHLHNSVELKFIVDGDYSAIVEDEKISCKRGDVIFVDSRQPHTYISVTKSINYVLVIDYDLFKLIFPQDKTLPKQFSLNEKFDLVEKVLEQTQKEWKNMNYEQKKGFVFRILGMMLKYCGVTTAKYDEENIVSKIMEYIREHCHEEITLDSLSKTFGYSKNYFSNFFNKHFYMNLRECVNRFRIERAIRLKSKNANMSLCTIAEQCGYNSMNTFYRAFKRYSGEMNIVDS